MQYGQNIRRLRLSKGIKAQWVANQLGINISTYCNLEAGRGKIDLDRAARIAALLGVSVQDILSEAPVEIKKTGTEAGS